MAVQTSYSIETESAYPGQPGNMGPQSVVSRVASTVIPFGYAVCRAADQTASIPATGLTFLGVAKRDLGRQANASGVTQYEIGDEVAIMEDGYAWVVVEEAVVAGDPVFYRRVNGTPGRFRNDAATGDAVAVTGATFETAAALGGVAKIRMPYGQ